MSPSGYCCRGCDVRRSSSDDVTCLDLASDADDDEERIRWWLFRGVVDADVDVVDRLTAELCRPLPAADNGCLDRDPGLMSGAAPASVPTITASPFVVVVGGHRCASSAQFCPSVTGGTEQPSRRGQLTAVLYRSTGPAWTGATGASSHCRHAAGGQIGCDWCTTSVPQQPAVVALPPLALPLPVSATQ